MRTRKVVEPKLSEADLQAFGTQLLELDGWRSLRTDPVSDRFRGKGFGEVGMADMLYIRYANNDPYQSHRWAEVLWIEYKRGGRGPKALKREQHQREWQSLEIKRGALVWCAGLDFETTTKGFQEKYVRSVLNRSLRAGSTTGKLVDQLGRSADLQQPKPSA